MKYLYSSILVLVILLEIIFKPRLDFGKNIIFWYGIKKRKFLILF